MVAEGVTDFPAVLKRFQGLDADQIADRYDVRLPHSTDSLQGASQFQDIFLSCTPESPPLTFALPLFPPVCLQRMVLEAKMREEERRRKGLGGLLRGVGPMKTHAAPPLPSSDAPRLSAKDIVGGVSTFDEKVPVSITQTESSQPP